MTKNDTITEIMTLNPTVGAVFLAEFANEELRKYLERLREVRSGGGAVRTWCGPDDIGKSVFAAAADAA